MHIFLSQVGMSAPRRPSHRVRRHRVSRATVTRKPDSRWLETYLDEVGRTLGPITIGLGCLLVVFGLMLNSWSKAHQSATREAAPSVQPQRSQHSQPQAKEAGQAQLRSRAGDAPWP
jgi:hypothetical protein